MADQEIAKLIDALSSLSSSFSDDNFSKRLGTDSSLKLGLQKLYSILKYSVSPIAAVADGRDKKRGLEFLEQSQIQAVASLATAVVIATRSLSGSLAYLISFLVLKVQLMRSCRTFFLL